MIAKSVRETLKVDAYLPEDIKLEFRPKLILGRRMLIRGGYDPWSKVIRLPSSVWCRKPLVHEILHALSFFYREESLIDKALTEWRFVIEGLNEFFTGLHLYLTRSKYPCYDYWLNKTYTQCSISYEEYTKVFGVLVQVLVRLEDLKEIYFYNREISWQKIYTSFIRRYGLPNLFQDWPRVYDLEDAIIRTLEERGRRNLARKFETLLDEDIEVVLDYSSIIKF